MYLCTLRCKPLYMPVDTGDVCVADRRLFDRPVRAVMARATCTTGSSAAGATTGWTGERCDIGAEPVVGGTVLSTGAIIAIVVCMLIPAA